MYAYVLDVLGMSALSAPFLAMIVILAHYQLRRTAWRCRRRLGLRNPRFCPSTSSLGTAFQFLEAYYRPSIAYVLEAKQDEDEEQNDDGQPETPAKLLKRQLRRIRNGEKVDTLVLRL